MKLHKAILGPLLAVVLIALSANAKAITVDITSVTYFNLGTPNSGTYFLPPDIHPNTANLSILSSTLGSFLSFCLDPHQTFGTGTFERVLASTHYNATQTHLLQRLWFNSFASSSANPTVAAAFQYAVWEITNDTVINLNGPASLTNRVTITSPSMLRTNVEALLNAAQQPGNETQLWVLKNPTRQDLLTPITTAVPEAETYAMLIAGLGLMGYIARRRRQNIAALS